MPTFEQHLQHSAQSVEMRVERDKIEFAILVHQLMQKNGISKTELARRYGCVPSFITRVLKGDAGLTLTTMTKIVNALGVDSVFSLRIDDD